jgi:hypothetical protein
MSNSILMTHQQGKFKSYGENMWLTPPIAKGTPLPACMNDDRDRYGNDKLVIAYSRPLNLQNMFSVRNIHGRRKEVRCRTI